MKSGKSAIILTLLILSAIVIGGFLGEFFKGNSLLGFLSWGFPIGAMEPLVIDMKMLKLSLGLIVNINFASITALIVAIYIYTRL